MIGPRHMGSSPTLKRQLSRLSSSSSFQVRQSNTRIYTFLVAGGLLLLASVALLQFHLQGAPQSSKLSPRENGKSDEGIVPEQSWWRKNDWDQFLATGRERAVAKSKLGRKLGPVQVVKEGEKEESSDEGMDVGDEMEDDEDEESDQQALFDIDIDDRMLEEESEDEDPDLGLLAEVSNAEDSAEEDSAENPANEAVWKSGQKLSDNLVSAVSADEQGGERVDSAKSIIVGLGNIGSITTNHDGEELVRHESQKDDEIVKINVIPAWVLDIKLGSQQKGIFDTLQGFERELVKSLEKKKGPFFWDHALPIRNNSLENVEPLSAEDESKDGAAVVKPGGNVDGGASMVATQHLKGFKDFVESWKERFNSDDELVDDNVQQRLEGLREIEDALLLNGDGADKSKMFGALLKGPRGSFDRMNPISNPMLQDPDTPPGTWMTKTDKEMLQAMRGDRSSGGQQPKAILTSNILDVVVSKEDSVVRRQASSR